jgi:hypothetical protein
VTLLLVLSPKSNPGREVWPIVHDASGGYNKTGLLLAVLAIYERATRSQETVELETKESKIQTSPSQWSVYKAALSLGGLLYALHAHLGDSGTIISWTWTGYPIKGPFAGVHNPLVLLAMALGLVVSSSHRIAPVKFTPTYIAFGATSLFNFYAYRDRTGFTGGLGYAVFLCSFIAPVISNAAACTGPSGSQVGKVLGTAWLVYILLALADVWTVAYAFVPGGVYLRERTDL